MLIFVLFFAPFSKAQKVNISTGAGAILSNMDHWKLPYWDNGYEMHLSADYNINQGVSLFFTSSYQQMLFDNARISIIVPDVLGYNYSMKGENSTIIDLAAGTRFYATHAAVSPYLAFGTGVLFIKQGRVYTNSWINGNVNSSSMTLYDNTGKEFVLGQLNFGLGMDIAIIRQLQLSLNIKVIRAFSGPVYAPLTCSFRFP